MGYHSFVHDFRLTQSKVAERVGKESHNTNLLRLLQLDDELRSFLSAGELSTGHASFAWDCRRRQATRIGKKSRSGKLDCSAM